MALRIVAKYTDVVNTVYVKNIVSATMFTLLDGVKQVLVAQSHKPMASI